MSISNQYSPSAHSARTFLVVLQFLTRDSPILLLRTVLRSLWTGQPLRAVFALAPARSCKYVLVVSQVGEGYLTLLQSSTTPIRQPPKRHRATLHEHKPFPNVQDGSRFCVGAGGMVSGFGHHPVGREGGVALGPGKYGDFVEGFSSIWVSQITVPYI